VRTHQVGQRKIIHWGELEQCLYLKDFFYILAQEIGLASKTCKGHFRSIGPTISCEEKRLNKTGTWLFVWPIRGTSSEFLPQLEQNKLFHSNR
jgi:hypothetical protein